MHRGESSKVHVSYSVHGEGAAQQVVTLKTNDPYHPLIYLTIRGMTPQDLHVSAPSLLFDVMKGQALQKEIQVVGPPTMDINAVTTDNPSVKASFGLKATDQEKKIWRLQVSLIKEAPVGDFKSFLIIKTTYSQHSVITIPIAIAVHSDLQVTPPRIVFGFVLKGNTQQKELIIQSQSDTPFIIKGIKLKSIDPGTLRIIGINGQLSVRHRLTMELNPQQPEFVDGSVMVETNVPGEEAINVPVTALIPDDNHDKR